MIEKSKKDIENVLSSSENVAELTETMLDMVFGINDREWAESRCLRLLDHPNVDVAGLAATCLGHIARIYKTIGQDTVPSLEAKLADARISGRVEDALDDIRMFAKG